MKMGALGLGIVLLQRLLKLRVAGRAGRDGSGRIRRLEKASKGCPKASSLRLERVLRETLNSSGSVSRTLVLDFQFLSGICTPIISFMILGP